MHAASRRKRIGTGCIAGDHRGHQAAGQPPLLGGIDDVTAPFLIVRNGRSIAILLMQIPAGGYPTL
jgi:hypothetical protein